MSEDDDDFEVGYGKPPKKNRFKKGHSGNSKGRPKCSRNFAKDLDDVLNARMKINENGRSRNVSTQLAVLMRLRQKAVKGEARALERLLSMADQRSAEREAQGKERILLIEEDDILLRFAETLVLEANGEDDGDGE